MEVTIYGIRNCNTVKSALAWLSEKGVVFGFHDYKTRGITESKLKQWCSQVGWESLVNKRGTTWRQLPPAEQKRVTNKSSAVALMLGKASVIKRPLVESGDRVIALGFDPDSYSRIFK